MTRAHAGTIRDHGPDCRGVGQPPVEPEAPLLAATPSPAEEATVESSTEPGATVEPASAPERGPMPAYTRLDEDDGEIDGGAVPLRAETSHRDIPAEFAEPSLLGPPQRSRVEQLEDEIAGLEGLRARAERMDAAVELQQVQYRRVRFLEGQLDASREESRTLREEVATLRTTLSQALALIGRLSGL